MSNDNRPVALVTGASSGIGEITAQQLVKAGYRVFGTSRQANAAVSHSFEMLPLDVTSDESAANVVAQVLRLAGRIDLLVNNAGRGISPAGAEEVSIEQAQSLFNTNFFGVARMTNAVLPHMRKQGSGRIINIGSVLGFMPMPYMAFYSATKYALRGYSESLDHELRSMGIRVSVIEPAFMKTGIDVNSAQADLPMDIYRDIRNAIDKRLAEMLNEAEDPAVVASVVIKAAQSVNPQASYTAGKAAGRLKAMSTLLPARLLGAGIRRHLRIH